VRAGGAEGNAGGAKSSYERARAAFKPPSSLGKFVASIRSEVAAAVLPSTNLPSVMRRREIDESVELRPGEGPSQARAWPLCDALRRLERVFSDARSFLGAQ